MKPRKLFAALLGVAAGICTDPLALILWPAFCAWFLWNEETALYHQRRAARRA